MPIPAPFQLGPGTTIQVGAQDYALSQETPAQQAAGGNKPLPPHWFPLNSTYVARMPNGYIQENAVLRSGT